MTRRVIIFCAFIVLLLIAVFVLRKGDLTIHVIAETSSPTSTIHLQMDDETLFNGEVNSGAYFGEKIEIENMGVGFHTLKIEAVKDGITYQKDDFFLFNRTIIITYFDRPSLEEKPYFDVWRKFGKFLPD